MLNIGLSELLLSLMTIIIYYYFFKLEYKIETCLLIILIGSLISLSFSIYYVKLFYRNKLISSRW